MSITETIAEIFKVVDHSEEAKNAVIYNDVDELAIMLNCELNRITDNSSDSLICDEILNSITTLNGYTIAERIIKDTRSLIETVLLHNITFSHISNIFYVEYIIENYTLESIDRINGSKLVIFTSEHTSITIESDNAEDRSEIYHLIQTSIVDDIEAEIRSIDDSRFLLSIVERIDKHKAEQ